MTPVTRADAPGGKRPESPQDPRRRADVAPVSSSLGAVRLLVVAMVVGASFSGCADPEHAPGVGESVSSAPLLPTAVPVPVWSLEDQVRELRAAARRLVAAACVGVPVQYISWYGEAAALDVALEEPAADAAAVRDRLAAAAGFPVRVHVARGELEFSTYASLDGLHLLELPAFVTPAACSSSIGSGRGARRLMSALARKP